MAHPLVRLSLLSVSLTVFCLVAPGVEWDVYYAPGFAPVVRDTSVPGGAWLQLCDVPAGVETAGLTVAAQIRKTWACRDGAPAVLRITTGAHADTLSLYADRVALGSGESAPLDTSAWHLYRWVYAPGMRYLYIDEQAAFALSSPGWPETTAEAGAIRFGLDDPQGTGTVELGFLCASFEGAITPETRTPFPAAPTPTPTSCMAHSRGFLYDAAVGECLRVGGAIVNCSPEDPYGSDGTTSHEADGSFGILCHCLLTEQVVFQHPDYEPYRLSIWQAWGERRIGLVRTTPYEPDVLARTIAELEGTWWSAFVVVDDSNPGAVSYRAVQPLMAGADEYAEIVRYPSPADAQSAFGTADDVFHGLPARRGAGSSYYAAHYQDSRSLAWLCGPRIFRAVTQYNSTYCGLARDPGAIAQALYDAADFYGLLPTPTPPDPEYTPTPTPTGEQGEGPPLSVEPLPCEVPTDRVTVSGWTGLYCNVWVRSDAGSAFAWAADGSFSVDVPLVPGRCNDLTVTSTNDFWPFGSTVQTTDRNGRPLAVWCLPGPDSDGDGVPDALESASPPSGQTNRFLPDSDGDGLGDGEEDANHNGTHDPGETNPRQADTDGDGLEDGIERLACAGGDPLDPFVPGAFVDADGDGLPADCDPDDAQADADGDRFTDGYEAAVLGVAAADDPATRPPLADVNADGQISNLDALIVQAFFMGKTAYGDHPALGQGDAGRDGHVSNMDALVVQSFFLELLARLPL